MPQYPSYTVHHAPAPNGGALCGATSKFHLFVSTHAQVAKKSWGAMGCERCKAILDKPAKTPRKPRQPPVLVTCFGGVWRLSAAEWKRFLVAVALGKDRNLDNFGTHLGQIAEYGHVTDISADVANEALAGLLLNT